MPGYSVLRDSLELTADEEAIGGKVRRRANANEQRLNARVRDVATRAGVENPVRVSFVDPWSLKPKPTKPPRGTAARA